MQQPRLTATAARAYRAIYLAPNNHVPKREFAAAIPTGRTADPAVFYGERDRELQPTVPHGKTDETQNLREPDTQKPEPNEECKPGKETEPLTQAKPLPGSFAPRVEKLEVHNPAEPQFQRKHRKSTLTLDEASCAGLDGSPWPNEREEEDSIDYYKHHKASPLSKIKFVDTRKPITRATDGTADAAGNEYPEDVIGWRPEQLDTAEEALERARTIWWENATRGDPDSPHGRVLRMLRGEWF